MRCILLALLAVLPAAAQTPVTAQRLAGLLPTEWPSGDGGPATDAYLTPLALAFDRDGSLLIADAATTRIRRYTPAGSISTALDYTRCGLKFVVAIAIDSRGNLYLVDNRVPDPSALVEVTPDGHVIPIATFPGGILPGIAVDAQDNLYYADFDNNVVWKRSLGGVSQVAARVTAPWRVGFDQQGNLLVSDSGRMMRVNADGSLTVLAGAGFPPIYPTAFAAAPDGSLYIASDDYAAVFRLSASGALPTVAGTGDTTFSDGCAASGGQRVARNAAIGPVDVAVDAAGRVYVADARNSRLRRIDPDGSIRTVAGSGSPPRSSPLVLHAPGALAADGAGNVYFADRGANRIRQVTPSGQVVTAAGVDSPAPGEDAACFPYDPGADMLLAPGGVALDSHGSLYISDTGHQRVRRRAPDGTISTVADGLNGPGSIAAAADGNVYFVDSGAGITTLYRIGPDGRVDALPSPAAQYLALGLNGELMLNGSTLYAGLPGGTFRPLGVQPGPGAIAADPSGAVWTAYGDGGLFRETRNCNLTTFQGNWSYSTSIAADPQGDLYVSDSGSIWRVPAIPLSGPDTPSPSVTHIRNAASNLDVVTFVSPRPCFLCQPYLQTSNDSIAPGEILRLTGGCLGPLEPVAPQPSIQVAVGGVTAPLRSVQSAEVLAVVPQGAVPGSTVSVEVSNQGKAATVQGLMVEAAVPGVFLTEGIQAAAINEDSTLNSATNPAAAGSIVSLFLTGTGLTDPPWPDGIPPSEPLPRVALPVAVAIGGAPAEVLYAGDVEGLVGVTQLNVRVPGVMASNAVAVQVTVGGIGRNQAVTIAVK